jgi:capsular polysaccharide transport system ATP-binding protein
MIRLENVTKSYMTLSGRNVVFRDLSIDFPRDVNVGLIGRNGAGKSTLMRLLSSVDLPDSGKIITGGRLSWPVGLKGGLEQRLTGRDNVKFVCRIQGVRGPEMREKIDFVQDFAELGEYFDRPVSGYSSGMRARLAFGTSMAFDFDYYLIDEILAVGDARFKKKSRALFQERLKDSKLILVSHNMKLIGNMCDSVVLLEHGRAKYYDDASEGIAAYRKTGDKP